MRVDVWVMRSFAPFSAVAFVDVKPKIPDGGGLPPAGYPRSPRNRRGGATARAALECL
jgi:hypothetical protein